MVQKISFLHFRSNALQGLAMLTDKQRRGMRGMSKDDIEEWVEKAYKHHYPIKNEKYLP